MTSVDVSFETHKVGPNPLEDVQVSDIYGKLSWVVYWYATNGFEGVGQAVAKQYDGRYQLHDLSHDARFGPTEFWVTDAKRNLTDNDVFVSSAFELVFEGEFKGFEEDCRIAISDKVTQLEFRELFHDR